MTLAEVANPDKWSAGWRWLVGGLVFVLFTAGSTAGAALYSFGELRQAIADDLAAIRSDLSGVKKSIDAVKEEQKKVRDDLAKEHDDAKDAGEAAAFVGRDLAQGRAANLPRIDRLEDAVNKQIMPALAAIKEHAENTDKTTARHDEDIRSTRDDVAAIRAVIAPRKESRGR